MRKNISGTKSFTRITNFIIETVILFIIIKTFSSKREEDSGANHPLQLHKSFTCIFSSIKAESEAVNTAFGVMNSAIGVLKAKQHMNSDDIRKLKIGYDDKTTDLKQKLKEARKLEENLNRAIAEKRRITDLQEAKRKRNGFKLLF
jgi:hypothetical protein